MVYSSEKGRICAKCGWPAADCHCSAALPGPQEAVSEKIRATLNLENAGPGKKVTVIEQPFRPAHLAGARWVVAAATPEVNRDVAAAAASRGLFVNAVDDPSVATAYLGGVIRRGPVEIAISTGGLAPALAGLLREALEAVLPDDLERWSEVATRIRSEWKRDQVPMAQRRPLLLRALDRLYVGAPS